MLILKNIQLIEDQEYRVIKLEGEDQEIDAQGLTLLPGMIVPDVLFESKNLNTIKNWSHLSRTAIDGGITSFILTPPSSTTFTKKTMDELTQFIHDQLNELGIPLNTYFFGNYASDNYQEIGRLKHNIKGILVYKDGLPEEAKIYQLAAQENIIIVIQPGKTPESFLKIERAIELTERFNGQLLILNVRTKKEVEYIKEAKKRELLIYSATSIPNLFPDLFEKSLSNQEKENDVDYIWESIKEETIDLIGIGSEEDWMSINGNFFEEFNHLKIFLPLLLNAYHNNKITLSRIIDVCHNNTRKIFNIYGENDYVLADLSALSEYSINNQSITLRGRPAYTILKGKIFKID